MSLFVLLIPLTEHHLVDFVCELVPGHTPQLDLLLFLQNASSESVTFFGITLQGVFKCNPPTFPNSSPPRGFLSDVFVNVSVSLIIVNAELNINRL